MPSDHADEEIRERFVNSKEHLLKPGAAAGQMAKPCPTADMILGRCTSVQRMCSLSSCFVYMAINCRGTLQAGFQGMQAAVAHEEEPCFITHTYIIYTAVYTDLDDPSCLLNFVVG